MAVNGFVNVLKPPGMTSHDVVGCLRRIYGTKKVGHAGTLDPAAAGVLPVAVGYATRLLEYMAETDKSYRAEVLLGMSTDTDDDTGTILRQEDFIMPAEAVLKKVLADFCGEIMQVPPIYSAIKINGRKACDLARKDIEVQLSPRRITIRGISLLECRSDRFSMDVYCSKGTYIRSLCADIGRKLQIPAVMGFLVRTAAGCFKLADACSLEEIGENPSAALQGIDVLLGQLEDCEVGSQEIADFRQGRKIPCTGGKRDGTAVLVHSGGVFAGIGKINEDGRYIAPCKVFRGQ